ncbi:alpha-L-fucosidase 2 [Sphingomonas gellani]|uniref:Alpha-L-fucosidase 2 n=1 Tax=Sphingomonas gellani TaxID=1166340 RepID=A0A1H8DVX5_9SPHN|nr:glycoside hydrolase family 95 protein [Sphingomonas gellani]SEN11325.1 alpha-L-fucosidase 2 [Sphingomonas gellani]
MAFTRRETMAIAAASTAVAAVGTGKASARSTADTPRLWYRQPATVWTEALPIGNGVLGAMVFGGTGHERLQLNEGTLWAGGPYDPVNPAAKAAFPRVRQLVFADRIEEAEKLVNAALIGTPAKQMPYQALGDLVLDFPGLGEVSDYRRELDLATAMATTRFVADGREHVRQVIASPGDKVIAIRLSASGRGKLAVDIMLTSPQVGATSRADGVSGLLLSGRNGAAESVPGALTFAARLLAVNEGGQVTVTPEGRLSIRGADAVTLLLSMATSFRRFDDVSGDPLVLTAAAIAHARSRPFARIAADASAAHDRLFRRVSIDLGSSAAAHAPTDERIRASQSADDPALAALYFNYGRYLLIACSQPGGQAATLQGLWNDSLRPPWESKYTININTEMNYWPAHSTNLAECAEPLVRLVRELAITGERTAREMYGARGWVAHHNTDIWRATAPIDGAPWGMWPTGGAWLCTHLWEHYDYTRDLDFLRSVYPLLAGSARFFLDTLQVDPRTGYLVTNPSLSPENQHGHGGSLCAGPTMDMAILRDLFAQTSEAAALMGSDPAMIVEMRAASARLAPYKIGRQGQLQEWQQDWDADAPEQNHRHVSHLYGLYPSHQISPDGTPALAAAARRSLELRGDRATGWATAWRINLWARLRQGDHAHDILRFLLGSERTYPNMFDAHPPFQIDGNFGGTAGIVEMLMQSRGDVIDLLPALPRSWPSGSITGLCARGACGVDLSWRSGRVARVTLRPRIAGQRTVSAGGKSVTVSLTPSRPLTLSGRAFA